METTNIPVVPCPPEARTGALRALHDGLPKDLQQGLVVALKAIDLADDSVLDGLLVALAERQIAAVWNQIMPGNAAAVWPPAFDSPACVALLNGSGRFLDQHGIELAQILISPLDTEQVDQLSRGHFFHLADLRYLVAEKSSFPSAPPDSSLQFEPSAAESPERLSRLILKTYVGTLDCSLLGGLRSIEDVVAGYRGTGNYLREHWIFVRHDQTDVGVLILANHSPESHWELVYMGVVPEARGYRYGMQIVRESLWRAGQGGAERLFLAVDQANRPALAMYDRAGFIGWDRRQVFVRLFGGRPLS